MDEVLRRLNAAAGLACGESSRRKQPSGTATASNPKLGPLVCMDWSLHTPSVPRRWGGISAGTVAARAPWQPPAAACAPVGVSTGTVQKPYRRPRQPQRQGEVARHFLSRDGCREPSTVKRSRGPPRAAATRRRSRLVTAGPRRCRRSPLYFRRHRRGSPLHDAPARTPRPVTPCDPFFPPPLFRPCSLVCGVLHHARRLRSPLLFLLFFSHPLSRHVQSMSSA